MLAPKVSIIIPVYNAALYLHRCLYSAVTQSLKNIEIVVVNDASTDGSLQIIEEFITLDKRIKFINFSKNKGNGIGRNTALKAACGTYVLFLDADDWLNKNAAKILYNTASKNKSDVVLMGYTQHYMTSKKTHIMLPNYVEDKYNAYRYFLLHIKGFGSMPWCYLYARKLLIQHKITFTEGIYFEDINFVAKAVFFANKIIAKNDISLYNYLVHDNSITGFLTKKKIEDLFTAHMLLKEFLIEQNVFKKYELAYLVRVLIYCVEFSFLGYFKMKRNQIDEELKQFMNDIRKSNIMSFESLEVLKTTSKELDTEKLSSKHMLSAYHFLTTLRLFYKPFKLIYKLKYRIHKLFN